MKALEELYDELANVETEYGLSPTDVHNILEDFFSQNVVIPKDSQLQEFADGRWWDLCYISENCEYRIKPSEPVYEWQWEFTYNGLICRTGFYTYEQIKAYMYNIKVTKIEETKRERK